MALIAIDVLRSARLRRQEYTGQWIPEPLWTDPYGDPERPAEFDGRVVNTVTLDVLDRQI